ncbi:MAG TPA: PDZ domain-containing protein [Vicinamibacteria bacterium]|nr:PDZ domain-containing protein [Vicinamibacteria bacterium]
MKRLAALVLAVPAVLLAGLTLGPRDVRAGEEKDGEKKVEKRVVVRHLGGSRLGVGLDDTEGDVRGAKVRSVDEDSPAEKAGLKEGDVIVRFDGEAVRSASHLARLVGETPAGRSVPIEVTRAGARQTLTATLAEGHRGFRAFSGDGRDFALEMPDFEVQVPEPPAPPMAPHVPAMPHAWGWKEGDFGDRAFRFLVGGPRKLGIEYMEIGEQLAGYFKLPGKTGVLVSSVDADGPAGKAGMKAGDVILKLDAEAIEDGEGLREAVAEAKGGKEVTVTVQRDGRPLDLKVTLAKPEPKARHLSTGIGT